MGASPKIVVATATMTAHGSLGCDVEFNAGLQRAMQTAVAKCLAQGITDSDTLRQAQLDARDRFVARRNSLFFHVVDRIFGKR